MEKSQKQVLNVLEKSHMIDRNIDKIIENHYANNKSALLLTGARQVGKTIAFRRYAEKMGMELVEINFHEDQLAKNIFIGAQNAGLATVFFSRRGDALPEDLSRSNLIVITSLPELLQYV